jgi:threonine dehydratase
MKTPQIPAPELAAQLGLSAELWLKREDLHHYNSHKGRSIPLMITEYFKKQGFKKFVISSSGNAALAAIIAIQTHNKSKPDDPFSLTVFVGKKIDESKLTILKQNITDPHITIEQTENPKQEAVKAGQESGIKLLRQSSDDLALRGYTELAKELAKIENLSAVFIPTSSGTTAVGLDTGFKMSNLKVQIHVVQTPNCHPIIDAIFARQGKETVAAEEPAPSLASSIVDNIGLRKEKVADVVTESGGEGWIATNEDIKKIIEIAKKTLHFPISGTSALSLVGLSLAIKNNQTFAGPVVCLITGK